MVRRPSRFAVRAMRQAISPRLAIRTEANMPGITAPRTRLVVSPKFSAKVQRAAPGLASVPAGAGGSCGGAICTGAPGDWLVVSFALSRAV